jgi:hypothetical protein
VLLVVAVLENVIHFQHHETELGIGEELLGVN